MAADAELHERLARVEERIAGLEKLQMLILGAVVVNVAAVLLR